MSLGFRVSGEDSRILLLRAPSEKGPRSFGRSLNPQPETLNLGNHNLNLADF